MSQPIGSSGGSFKQPALRKTSAVVAGKTAKKRQNKTAPPASKDAMQVSTPVWASPPGAIRRLTEPVRSFIPGHQERHAARQKLHGRIFAAVALSRVRDKASLQAWRDVVTTAGREGLDLSRQLKRCSNSRQHVLDMLLDVNDYEALALLKPWLKVGVPYGRVQVYRHSGFSYIGEVRLLNDRVVAHGRGHRDCPKGVVEEGQFVNDYLKGDQCTLIVGGIRFEGPFAGKGGEGLGKCTGSTFVIENSPWKDGRRHGTEVTHYHGGTRTVITRDMGIIKAYQRTEPNGETYEGEIDPNTWQKHGRGKQTLSDASSFEGTWRMGRKEGKGLATFGPEHMLFGYRYSGDFVNDEAHGYGTFENVATGELTTGFYRQGMLVGKPPPILVDINSDSDFAVADAAHEEPVLAVEVECRPKGVDTR